MGNTTITNLSSLHQRAEGTVTLDTLRATATRTNSPQVVQTDLGGRCLIICPGGAVMGASQPYLLDEAYDLAFRVALTRDWARPVVVDVAL